eukprot:Pgem_evm1s17701
MKAESVSKRARSFTKSKSCSASARSSSVRFEPTKADDTSKSPSLPSPLPSQLPSKSQSKTTITSPTTTTSPTTSPTSPTTTTTTTTMPRLPSDKSRSRTSSFGHSKSMHVSSNKKPSAFRAFSASFQSKPKKNKSPTATVPTALPEIPPVRVRTATVTPNTTAAPTRTRTATIATTTNTTTPLHHSKQSPNPQPYHFRYGSDTRPQSSSSNTQRPSRPSSLAQPPTSQPQPHTSSKEKVRPHSQSNLKSIHLQHLESQKLLQKKLQEKQQNTPTPTPAPRPRTGTEVMTKRLPKQQPQNPVLPTPYQGKSAQFENRRKTISGISRTNTLNPSTLKQQQTTTTATVPPQKPKRTQSSYKHKRSVSAAMGGGLGQQQNEVQVQQQFMLEKIANSREKVATKSQTRKQHIQQQQQQKQQQQQQQQQCLKPVSKKHIFNSSDDVHEITKQSTNNNVHKHQRRQSVGDENININNFYNQPSILKWEKELQMLSEHGLVDVVTNVHFLNEMNGRVDMVVARLLIKS